ncbi:POR isoform 17, partial [Pongo abelii]
MRLPGVNSKDLLCQREQLCGKDEENGEEHHRVLRLPDGDCRGVCQPPVQGCPPL